MTSKYAQMAAGVPPPPMDPSMMMGAPAGGVPPPPMDPSMMMGGAVPPPPGGVPPPPMDPSMMMGAPGGMPPPPMDPSMMMGAPPAGPAVPEGMDPNVAPETAAAADQELGNEDLRNDVKTMADRIKDLEKVTGNIEQLLKGVASHIGISTGATGSRDHEEGDDAEKAAALEIPTEEEIVRLDMTSDGLRKYAAALLAEAEGIIERQ